MNQDDFLYQFQEQPRDEFRMLLKSKLIAKNSEKPTQFNDSIPLFWYQRRWAIPAGIAFLLAIGLLFAPVNTNQTLAQVLYRWVAGLKFIEVDGLPTEKPLRENEIVVEQIPVEKTLSIAEAQEILPFLNPSWVPEGYVLEAITYRDFGEDTFLPEDDFTEINLVWIRGDDQISWSVVDREIPMLITDVQSVELLDVQGVEVALIRGGWDSVENSYGFLEFKTFSWEVNKLFYHLSGNDAALSNEEAVLIIESVVD